MKHIIRNVVAVILSVMALSMLSGSVVTAAEGGKEAAANETQTVLMNDSTGSKAIAAAICMGLAAAAGAWSMGHAISKSSESISRQPEVEDKIRSSLMLGLVFIETVVIYALIVAILIIFVL